jgi:hypothetical protein
MKSQLPKLELYKNPESQAACLAWEIVRLYPEFYMARNGLIPDIDPKDSYTFPDGWPPRIMERSFDKLTRNEQRWMKRWAKQSLVKPSQKERGWKLKEVGCRPKTVLMALRYYEIALQNQSGSSNKLPNSRFFPGHPSRRTYLYKLVHQAQNHFLPRINKRFLRHFQPVKCEIRFWG